MLCCVVVNIFRWFQNLKHMQLDAMLPNDALAMLESSKKQLKERRPGSKHSTHGCFGRFLVPGGSVFCYVVSFLIP